MQLNITMDEHDFDQLSTVSMRWAGHDWESHAAIGRFERLQEDDTEPPGMDWPGWQLKMAYWAGNSWINVILMRGYLAGLGYSCKILWDEATNDAIGEYVILTDYETECWKKRKETEAAGNATTARARPGETGEPS